MPLTFADRVPANTTCIAGVEIVPLRIIPTPGGPVLHMLRADSPLFAGFGELYFSEVLPGSVKAWKQHSKQTQYFAVPVGLLKLVLFDDREQSPTRGLIQEVLLGRPDHYALLRIPVGVWYGFIALGQSPSLIANCADIPHDPAESTRLDADSAMIPYRWQEYFEDTLPT